MFYAYVLYSKKDSGLYIGYTSNLKQRFESHNKQRNKATKHRTPFELIHYEAFTNPIDARAREKYLKSGHDREQLKSMLKKTFSALRI